MATAAGQEPRQENPEAGDADTGAQDVLPRPRILCGQPERRAISSGPLSFEILAQGGLRASGNPRPLPCWISILSPDSDYLDIGAWIGPTVLYGASKARHVWCFEPDPTAYPYLAWNLDLNGFENVSAFGVALSDQFGVARMASVRGEPGDSTSSLLHDGAHGSDALTIAWDQFEAVNDLSGVSLVKMDIEGAEFFVLPSVVGWKRYDCIPRSNPHVG